MLGGLYIVLTACFGREVACARNEPYCGERCAKARRMRGRWDGSIQTDFFEVVGALGGPKGGRGCNTGRS